MIFLNMKLLFPISLIVIVAIITACNPSDECREKTSVNMQIGFYSKTVNPSTKKIQISSQVIDSIWVRGVGMDSLVYNNKKNEKLILIPLNSTADHSKYIVQFNEITDTISVFHQNNEQYYLSLECGCIVAHTIDEVVSTSHYIDSIAIVYPEINNTNIENVQIFHF